ncbi:MAG: hypothetical protein IJV16_04565 [Lachnospiraceae bacterium]|nr:hypothetical protein [Lachnospiraceae bacterium]MBR1523251.1 hypothetical protein [Lachnospiraceae bacterium]
MDNNDIELFSTTDFKAKDKVVSILVRHRVSYLERWEKVPLLKRREYGGAKELCVIYVNGNQYGKAKKILDEFNESYKDAKRSRRRKRRAEAEAAQQMQGMNEMSGVEDKSDDSQAGFDYDPMPNNSIDDGIDDI